MTVINFSGFLLYLVVITTAINASQLSVSKTVDRFLTSLSSRPTTKGENLKDSRALDTALFVLRPPVYEISFQPLDGAEIARLAGSVGIPDSLRKFAGYDEKRGIIYFSSPQLCQLSDETTEGMERLRKKAFSILEKLLGEESRLFVFANIETDSAIEKPQTEPHCVMQTFRFTRKINGCHIIDNSAYVRIMFTGNEELCGFEIRNPRLSPVICERMVKLSATRERLELFAASKNTVRGFLNEQIRIKSITALKAIQSYVSSSAKNRLIPCISIWCEYSLENGDSFQKYLHFIIDASQVSNIEDYMLEPVER